jgi:hypothetical protein
VEVSDLRTAPFELPWGTHINAKVSATNIVGESAFSEVNNGGQILTTPYKPINLVEYEVTISTSITVQWEPNEEDGGTPVLDYRLWYAPGNQQFSVLQTALTETRYTAISLYEGITYSFKVHARNAEGYGEFSDITQIIAAIAPAQPFAPITIWLNDIV